LEIVENNGFFFRKDLTNDYANAYNVVRGKETPEPEKFNLKNRW
jgi:hypothetical protein